MTSGMGSIVGDAVRSRRVAAGAERQCMRTSASARLCMAENALVSGRTLCKVARGGGMRGRSSAAQASGILEGAEKFEPTRPAQQTVEECWYDWKCGSRVGYVKAGDEGPPLLLVHGFGVGHWHFEHNIEELSRICRVYAVDLIGQGSSWPSPEGSLDLQFSAETWVEQLASFTTDVVQGECGDEQPVYVAGNSLGGYLAVALAAQHPGLVKGVALLNSTPFWGTGPNPETSPVLSSAMPYNGLGEPPKLLKWAVEKLWFNKLRSSNTVEWLIRQVYSAPDAVDGRLVANIVNAADHPLALQAFMSVFFSPASVETFDDFVKDMQCPACMLYGKEDPWVKPLWGQRLKRLKPEMDYFELSPCGHCPHHETPEAVNLLLTGWLQAQERGGDCPLPTGRTLEVPDRTGCVTVTHVDGSPRTWLEKCDYAVWQLLRRFRSGSPEAAN